MSNKKILSHKLSAVDREKILKILKSRFEKNANRHQHLEWETVLNKLKSKPDTLWTLCQMENTGGEPDVLNSLANEKEIKAGTIVFCDCSAESPKGRRSLCYDREALDARKEHKPQDSAMEMAAAIGIEILDEEQYRELQKLGNFDTKTSSWLKTPAAIRKLGGAICGERRYNHIFIGHNSAPSYYAVRGFRGLLKI